MTTYDEQRRIDPSCVAHVDSSSQQPISNAAAEILPYVVRPAAPSRRMEHVSAYYPPSNNATMIERQESPTGVGEFSEVQEYRGESMEMIHDFLDLKACVKRALLEGNTIRNQEP